MGSSSAWPTPGGRTLGATGADGDFGRVDNLTRFANYGTIAAIGRRRTIAANYICDLSAMFGKHEIVHSLMDGSLRADALPVGRTLQRREYRQLSNSRARNRKVRGSSLSATQLRLRPTARKPDQRCGRLHLHHAISDAVRILTAWNSRARPDVPCPNC